MEQKQILIWQDSKRRLCKIALGNERADLEGFDMSEEKPMGLTIAEKFFGLITILIGALTVNFTSSDPPEGVVAPFSNIFIAGGLALVAIGIFLVLAKTE